jgi:hypothetical protein
MVAAEWRKSWNRIVGSVARSRTNQDRPKDEYLVLQKFYEELDDRMMKIKGWSANASGNRFNTTMHHRMELIEKVFRTVNFVAIERLQIYSSWFKAFKKSDSTSSRTCDWR